jgi:hypothetical protein
VVAAASAASGVVATIGANVAEAGAAIGAGGSAVIEIGKNAAAARRQPGRWTTSLAALMSRVTQAQTRHPLGRARQPRRRRPQNRRSHPGLPGEWRRCSAGARSSLQHLPAAALLRRLLLR